MLTPPFLSLSQDCGPVGADNFTKSDDDGWWDDDDDYWAFNDVEFVDQTNPKANQHAIKKFRKPTETAGPAAMFLTVLEGMVYTIGCIFALAGAYLAYRWYHGYSLPFMAVFSPDMLQSQSGGTMSQHEFDMAPSRKMPITPDVIRT